MHAFLLATLLAFAAPAQDGAGGHVPPRPSVLPRALALEPGVLPEGTSPEARERWEALALANRAEPQIEAFDLAFFARHRSHEGTQSNDLEARYRFLSPRFVRMSLKSGREHVRGPRGDFLLDGAEVQELSARAHVEDRRQLDEAAAIARNFLALTDPSRLRLARLAALDAPPASLPESLAGEAARLVWIEATSPDFHLVPRGGAQPTPLAAAAPPPLYRAALGVDPAEQRVELAIVQEESGGAPVLSSATMLIQLRRHAVLDGLRVPRELRIHEVDLTQSPWVFRPRPTSELYLRPESVGLRPALTPESFVP